MTLPNGFSDDFSRAPEGTHFIAYVAVDGDIYEWYVGIADGRLFHADYDELPDVEGRPLCWCLIPTPGDDILNELAGRGK